MSNTIKFVSSGVKEYVANIAKLGGDPIESKIDTAEEYAKLKEFLANNKELPLGDKKYVKQQIKSYEKSVAKAVFLESKSCTAKGVISDMQKILEQEEGIKLKKSKIKKYIKESSLTEDKKNFLAMYGYIK